MVGEMVADDYTATASLIESLGPVACWRHVRRVDTGSLAVALAP
jgi:hypothetical protein